MIRNRLCPVFTFQDPAHEHFKLETWSRRNFVMKAVQLGGAITQAGKRLSNVPDDARPKTTFEMADLSFFSMRPYMDGVCLGHSRGADIQNAPESLANIHHRSPEE